ncbi:hypothetical protein D3C84_849080 [compost metagenome]
MSTCAPIRSATSRVRGAFSSGWNGMQPSKRKSPLRSNGECSFRRVAKASMLSSVLTLLRITPRTFGSFGPPNNCACNSTRPESSVSTSFSGAETRITSASRLLARCRLTRAA